MPTLPTTSPLPSRPLAGVLASLLLGELSVCQIHESSDEWLPNTGQKSVYMGIAPVSVVQQAACKMCLQLTCYSSDLCLGAHQGSPQV